MELRGTHTVEIVKPFRGSETRQVRLVYLARSLWHDEYGNVFGAQTGMIGGDVELKAPNPDRDYIDLATLAPIGPGRHPAAECD